MTTVGMVTGAGRGMGTACAARLVDVVDVDLPVEGGVLAAIRTAPGEVQFT